MPWSLNSHTSAGTFTESQMSPIGNHRPSPWIAWRVRRSGVSWASPVWMIALGARAPRNSSKFDDSWPWWPALRISTPPTSELMRPSKPLWVVQSESVSMRSAARKAERPKALTFAPHPIRFASVVPCRLYASSTSKGIICTSMSPMRTWVE